MSKSTSKRLKKQKISVFPIINPNAAGIDVSDKEMMVCVPADRSDEPVQGFGTFTCDLQKICDYLSQCKIDTVAMESTGVYWVPLFLKLQDAGFDVYLVNAKHVKNVTGRKDDEEDAAWIQRLHSCGLLNRSFQPDNQTRELRSLMRHRKNLIQSQSAHVNRMQKILELMNIKLHTVISDILGKTGMNILNVIIKEKVRDAEKLSLLTDPRIKASKEDIVKSLEADWRDEHLFALEQYYDFYHYHQTQILSTEQQIEAVLLKMVEDKSTQQEIAQLYNQAQKSCKLRKNEFSFDAAMYLEKLCDVNLTEIFGISEITCLEILSEIGFDMSRFKNAKHFCSWLGLAPNTKVSGGKVISSKILKKKHTAGQVFRMAANSLWRSQNEFGDFYRRIKSRAGAAKTVVATARKIATVFYNMLKNKEAFNPKQLTDYQEKYKQQKIKRLEKQLAKLKLTA